MAKKMMKNYPLGKKMIKPSRMFGGIKRTTTHNHPGIMTGHPHMFRTVSRPLPIRGLMR